MNWEILRHKNGYTLCKDGQGRGFARKCSGGWEAVRTEVIGREPVDMFRDEGVEIITRLLSELPDALDGAERSIQANREARARQDARTRQTVVKKHITYKPLSQEISEATDTEILDWHANARLTGARCGGHKKAARNFDLEVAYLVEIKKRKLEPLPYSESGAFNGPGSA